MSVLRPSPTQSAARGDTYRIEIEGHLDEHWSQWLNGLRIQHEAQGYTLLTGYLPDQAALYGVLAHIRDLGIPLVSVTRRARE